MYDTHIHSIALEAMTRDRAQRLAKEAENARLIASTRPTADSRLRRGVSWTSRQLQHIPVLLRARFQQTDVRGISLPAAKLTRGEEPWKKSSGSCC